MNRSTGPLIIHICPDDQEFAAYVVDTEPGRVGLGATPDVALADLLGPLTVPLTVILDLPESVKSKPRCLRCGRTMLGGQCGVCAEGAKGKPGKGLHSPMLKRLVKGLEDD